MPYIDEERNQDKRTHWTTTTKLEIRRFSQIRMVASPSYVTAYGMLAEVDWMFQNIFLPRQFMFFNLVSLRGTRCVVRCNNWFVLLQK